MGPAGGWIGRAHRLLEPDAGDSVEGGYLLLPLFFKHEAAGDFEAVISTAETAGAIGRRFDDADLVALSVHTQGRALVKLGRATEGLALLDEAMIGVTGGELSPVVTGIVYCSVIEGCYEVHDIGRARDWTAALSRWCDGQPDLVAFTGQCLAHRTEIMQLQGAWTEALQEARKALERRARGLIAAQAFYQQGEIHRLRGEYDQAEVAYRNVSQSGGDPHPGLARLRLAQGSEDASTAAIRRAKAEATTLLHRVRVLPAFVDIMLAVGDLDDAADACAELASISKQTQIELHRATAEHARGAYELMRGEDTDALERLRHALARWQNLAVPYEEARTRVLVGVALRALGDLDTATLEFEAARSVFTDLEAEPDLRHLGVLMVSDGNQTDHGLTSRELEVLVLLTTGGTNRAIATELVLSERTVDRHVSNIFTKIGVSSRAAATAYAYEHQLI
jgi:ATP/maltotriose-dependent transcriptional regulator MalT